MYTSLILTHFRLIGIALPLTQSKIDLSSQVTLTNYIAFNDRIETDKSPDLNVTPQTLSLNILQLQKEFDF